MTLTVLAIIIIPLSTLFSQSIHSNVRSNEKTIATALAQEKIEELKSHSFDELCAKSEQKNEENLECNKLFFQRTTQILMENKYLLKITVQVQGNNEVVNIVTYRGKY